MKWVGNSPSPSNVAILGTNISAGIRENGYGKHIWDIPPHKLATLAHVSYKCFRIIDESYSDNFDNGYANLSN